MSNLEKFNMSDPHKSDTNHPDIIVGEIDTKKFAARALTQLEKSDTALNSKIINNNYEPSHTNIETNRPAKNKPLTIDDIIDSFNEDGDSDTFVEIER